MPNEWVTGKDAILFQQPVECLAADNPAGTAV